MKPSEALAFARPLRSHQSDALDRFATENEAGLLWEMGTGKTTEAIALLRAKYNVNRSILSTLIVSPVATLPNWMNEFQINSPRQVVESCQIVYGAGPNRIKLLADPDKKIFITNPETFDMPTVVNRLQQMRFDCTVIDEADGFKNYKSKRLKALLTITDRARYRTVMTGTPILNSFLDIWALFMLLDGGATFGRNFFLFREKYFKDKNAGWKGRPNYYPDYVPKPGIESEISRLMAAKCSRLKKIDCLDLPPLVRVVDHVELSGEQRKLYEEMEGELIAEVESGVCVATNALTRVLRMLQIITGYLSVESGTEKFAYHLKENPRLARLKERLATLTPHHKVIIWAGFSENYIVLRRLCDEMGLPYAEITGEIKDKRSEELRFQNDPACRVLIGNAQAGGIGINLTASTYAIYYSRDYSLRKRLQSEARNHRDGSQAHEKITLIDLVARNTLDEDVLNCLTRKENFAENVLEKIRLRRRNSNAIEVQ